MSNSIRSAASCSAGRLLGWSLDRAADIILRQFSLTSDKPSYEGPCVGYRSVWDNFVSSVIEEMGKKKVARARRPQLVKKLTAACKSVKTVFDYPCSSCDFQAKDKAKELWKEKVATKGPAVNPATLSELRKKVRMIVAGWPRVLENRSKEMCEKDCVGGLFEPGLSRKKGKEGYVPDQQGCLETMQGNGGTLATDDQSGPLNVVRMGCAKTKGKWRVVTMQSAYVKRVLRPVHESLYDYLSSFDWLVRGDVRRKDFRKVLEGMRSDESVISGDYEAATDNIYLEVVQLIVEEIALAGKGILTEEEERVLVGSFKDLKWVTSTSEGPIVRGSMMGNLMSFPVLCILNKACFDIVCDTFDTPFGRKRYGRFNGDDCMFVGNEAFYALWKEVTSEFGLKVNVEKTGFSKSFAELNSNCYSINDDRIVAKPVLSFLKKTNEKGEILSSILKGIKSFRMDVQLWIVNVVMRYEIAAKGINLTVIPRMWRDILLKKSWFRTAYSIGPCPERSPNSLIRQNIKINTKYPSPEHPSIEGSMTFVSGGTLSSPDPNPSRDFTFGSWYWKGRDGKQKRSILTMREKTVKRTLAMVHGPIPNEKYYGCVEELSRLLTASCAASWKGVKCRPYVYQMDRTNAYSRYKTKKIKARLEIVEGEQTWLWPSLLLDVVKEKFPHVLVRSNPDADPLWHPFLCYQDKGVFIPHGSSGLYPHPSTHNFERENGRKFRYDHCPPPPFTNQAKKNRTFFSGLVSIKTSRLFNPSFLESFRSRYTDKYSSASVKAEALW